MKELLLGVLSVGKNVAATPANKNVASSHAIFAKQLTGKEDVLIIEYGEGQPGDVARFADTTSPDMGVITGLAPAHLDHYPTLQSAGKDIFSLADYLHDKRVYVNGDSEAIHSFIKPEHHVYSVAGAAGWKVSDVRVGYDGTRFVMKNGKQSMKLHSGLLGRHQVGPIALSAALALELGLKKQQVIDAVSETKPFEHRMQPRHVGGAWIIDDTYNGNIDGIRAGLQLLKDLPAERKTYVTPGLVDQGVETESVHKTMGELIAAAAPDTVVLMQNTATIHIRDGLEAGGYGGEVLVEEDPLQYYTNLEHFLARGDLVVMQNDWTDNYA
jgi:UDP-N-acetylmuramoyl-tripeptide--D-alanyl-D-alanine ligase